MAKYKGAERFVIALEDGNVKVGDCLITKDIDGKAIFVVAHMANGRVYMVRKWLLKETRPMKDDDFDLMQWLEYDYQRSLPESLRAVMSSPVTLPGKGEVFGDDCFEWFKNVMHRVASFSKKSKYTNSWWFRDVVSSTNFALVGGYGYSYYGNASATWIGVRPAFAIEI